MSDLTARKRSSAPPQSEGDGLWRYYEAHRADLEDFWAREHSPVRHEREYRMFGRAVHLRTNAAQVLAAADLCQPLYSAAPPDGQPPINIRVVVNAAPPAAPGPVPDELARYIQYTGDGDWMAMLLGAWGHCQIDLARARALAVITPDLAARPELVSQWLLNTILTNLFMAGGLAMLHATCLVRDERALLLMAPHNSGKSTTALRLALAGNRLLSDSQVYVSAAEAPLGLQLLGFPVGRVKLRADMARDFPQVRPLLEAEQVRHETKYTLDLRQLDPALVQDSVVRPVGIDVCLLRRGAGQPTRRLPAGREEVLRAVVLNSLQTHTDEVWQRNLTVLEPLVERARWHHLEIGSQAEGIVQAVAELWAEAEGV